MTTPHMPYPRERTAPRFSSSHARELARFFADLEYLFATCRITSDRIKKDHTVRYMSIDDEEIWVSVPEFDSDTATFDEFKTAIFRSYPEANDLYRYSRNDLITLAIATQHRGICSVFDLAEYTRSFRGIASILIKCELSSHLDAQSIYIQGFRHELLSDIVFRLHTIDLKLIPAPSYSIDQVYKAAIWIFEVRSRSTMPNLPPFSTPSLPEPVASIASVAPIAPRITAPITPVASPKIPVPSCPSNLEIFKLQDHVAYAPPINSRTSSADSQPSTINLCPPPVDLHPLTVDSRPQPVDSCPQSVRPHADVFQPFPALSNPSRPCSIVPRTRNFTSHLVAPSTRLVASSFHSVISHSSSRCIALNIIKKPRRHARQARYQHPRRRIDPHRPRILNPGRRRPRLRPPDIPLSAQQSSTCLRNVSPRCNRAN
jgi:hypothetical protein